MPLTDKEKAAFQDLKPKPQRPSSTDCTQSSSHRPNSSGEAASIANVVTNQASTLALQISGAQKFAQDAGVALAHEAHAVASGKTLQESFASELNRLCVADHFQGFENPDWSDLEAIIAEAKKPLPSAPSLNLLPNRD
ncbi:MAG: hypothetical protein AAF215_05340 [Cyanobacteria bacterium P01_A01_bin.123]